MFCSNCGKTIRPESDLCQHCGASLGEDRFYGNTYTSSQVRIPAEALNEAPAGGMIAYTRTNYMSYDNQPENDVYSGTTYRPLLTDEEDQQLRDDAEAAAAAAEEEARRAEEEARMAEEAAANAAQQAEENEFAVEESSEEMPAGPAFDELVVEESEIIEEVPKEEPAPEEEQPVEEEAEDIPEEPVMNFRADGAIDPEEVSDLEPLPKAAISPRVLSYMEELDRIEQKRASGANVSLRMPSFLKGLRRKNAPIEEELPEAEDIPSQDSAYEAAEYAEEVEFDKNADYSEDADAEFDENADYAEDADAEFDENADYAEDADAEFDENAEYAEEADEGEYLASEEDDSFESYEDDEYAEEKPLPFAGLKIDFKALLQNRILQISAAAVAIVAVLAVGIWWLSYVTQQRSDIAGVTYSAYTKGIELLTGSMTEEYRSELTNVYLTNTGVAETSFSEDMAELNALMPEEPAENDELFITTLTIIQDYIADAIKADANAALKGTADPASELRWQALSNAVEKLKAATTVGELTVLIVDLESVVAPTPTPSPSPTPDNRKTLTNGMMDDLDVKKMQNRLINLGYLTGEPDGDFGNGTESALKAFQRAAGLTADGVATPAVQDALYDDNAPRVNATVDATAAPSNPNAQ